MSRARGVKQYQPLTRGLITEASPIDFPEGATIDELNFVYDANGNKRVKRKGLTTTDPNRPSMENPDFPSVNFTLTDLDIYHWEEHSIFIVAYLARHNGNNNYSLLFSIYGEDGLYKGQTSSGFGTGPFPGTIKNNSNVYAAGFTKINSNSLNFNVPLSRTVYFLDVEIVNGIKRVALRSDFIYYRDFEYLSTSVVADRRLAVQRDGSGNATPIDGDMNYLYNLANAGWMRADYAFSDSGGGKQTPLQHAIAPIGTGDPAYPALTESPNTYLQIGGTVSASVKFFNGQTYRDSAPGSGLAPNGSYILTVGHKGDNEPYSRNPIAPKKVHTFDSLSGSVNL